MRMVILFIAYLLLHQFFAAAQLFNLVVENGYGSGSYSEGDTVHVWSRSVSGDTVFANWAGDGTRFMLFENEWHTTLIVPEGTGTGNLSVSANYERLSASTRIGSKSYLLSGRQSGVISTVAKETFYAIPPSPEGCVFLFHGTDGKGENCFSKYEQFCLVKDIAFHRFAVFTLDANEVTMGDQNNDGKLRWDVVSGNPENNIDIRNAAALRDSIIGTFSFSPDIAVFSIGMSAGANFSDLCATSLGFIASAHITAKGNSSLYLNPGIIPVIWIMSENDHNESADNNVAYANFLAMSAHQAAQWHWFRRSPVYPQRFLRSMNAITASQSDSVFQRLQTNGLLDTEKCLTEQDISAIPATLLDGLDLTALQKQDVHQQLLCVNADHVLHSDYDKHILAFFDECLASLPVRKSSGGKADPLLTYRAITSLAREGVLAVDESIDFRCFCLYSATGRKVFESSLRRTDISTLVPGVYTMQIITADRSVLFTKLFITGM